MVEGPEGDVEQDYYGPTRGRSRGEQSADLYGDLDGRGGADVAPNRQNHGGDAGDPAVASDRQHAGSGGADAPPTQVAATDHDPHDDVDRWRSPTPPTVAGADAPRIGPIVPRRWRWTQPERGARRPETYRDELRGERTGAEDVAPATEVAVGPRGSLPPPGERTTGYVGAHGRFISIGGRSIQSLDWGRGVEDFGGVYIDGQVEEGGWVPPDGVPDVPRGEVYGPPVDVPEEEISAAEFGRAVVGVGEVGLNILGTLADAVRGG